MAKKERRFLVKLVSPFDTGYFKLGSRTKDVEKLSLRCYDPRVRKHGLFKEKKLS